MRYVSIRHDVLMDMLIERVAKRQHSLGLAFHPLPRGQYGPSSGCGICGCGCIMGLAPGGGPPMCPGGGPLYLMGPCMGTWGP